LEVVHERRWRLLDPHGIVLKNMNAPEDYDEARNWWRLKSLNEGEHIKRSHRRGSGNRDPLLAGIDDKSPAAQETDERQPQFPC